MIKINFDKFVPGECAFFFEQKRESEYVGYLRESLDRFLEGYSKEICVRPLKELGNSYYYKNKPEKVIGFDSESGILTLKIFVWSNFTEVDVDLSNYSKSAALKIKNFVEDYLTEYSKTYKFTRNWIKKKKNRLARACFALYTYKSDNISVSKSFLREFNLIYAGGSNATMALSFIRDFLIAEMDFAYELPKLRNSVNIELTPKGYQFMKEHIDRDLPDLGKPEDKRNASQILQEISKKRKEIDELLVELQNFL